MSSFETIIPLRFVEGTKSFDREADLPPAGTTLTFGMHGDVAAHYKATPSDPQPSTLDYLTASIGGCLIGTFTGSLMRARVPVTPGGVTGTATGLIEADDDGERERHLALHAKSMRGHVQTLSAKSYQSQFEEAPDYVIMFIPGEHFVTAALESDPELWDFAFERRVLLATPTNLVAIARTVAQVWRQDGLAKEAQEIGRLGAELYDRLRVASEHLKRVGGGLESAVNNYNKFVGSFERNVLSSGKRLAEKGVEIGKQAIEDVPLVESTPRYNAADAEGVEDALKSIEDRRDAAE